MFTSSDYKTAAMVAREEGPVSPDWLEMRAEQAEVREQYASALGEFTRTLVEFSDSKDKYNYLDAGLALFDKLLGDGWKAPTGLF